MGRLTAGLCDDVPGRSKFDTRRRASHRRAKRPPPDLDTSIPGVRGNPNDYYSAILDIESGTVSTLVYEYTNWLPRYFQDLADSWRGWEGEKTFGSLEGELLLSATHDGLGTVELTVTLRKPSPPSWSASASLDLGAGADIESVAKSISDWVEQH